MKPIKDERKGQGIAPQYFFGAEGAKWDRCVKKVKKAGTADSPEAVCTAMLGHPSKSESAPSEAPQATQVQPEQMAADVNADDVQTLIVQNPHMNASSFFNLLKSKGFVIKKEAEMTSAPLARAGAKVEQHIPLDKVGATSLTGTKKEAAHFESKSYFNFKFIEAAVDNPQGDERYKNRFRVILIQEGLGNTKDGFYYTKEALQSAVPVFEGRKMYADHPDKIEEETRPERSVKDVFGHFENVQFIEAKDGTGQLHADLVLLPDSGTDWVRARLMHAVDYSKKYPDKDFIGLSINASGDAEPIDATELLESGQVVPSAVQKVKEAMAEGLTEIRLVKIIDSAVSCDLVTEAGAKGKVIELLEAKEMEKKHEAEEKKMKQAEEAEEKKKEAEEAEEGEEAAPAAHGDEEQDKALIMDMLKKHGLVDGEGEESEKAYKAAKHYQKAYKAAGYEAEEAAHRACEAMKCSAEAHKMHQAEESEAEESEAKKKESEEAEEKKKESANLLKLKGENAQLKERLAALETEKYLDKKLQESKLPMSVTKKFRESLKAVKSKKEVDEKFDLFMEGYKAVGGEAVGLSAFVMVEKSEAVVEGISLDDCID